MSHKIGLLSLEKGHHLVFDALFKGKALSDCSNDLHLFFDEKLLNPRVYERLLEAQNRGEMTALFSSSPDFIVEYIAKRLKINIVESTQYEVDKHGFFVKISKLLNGDEKRKALLALRVDLNHVIAYSDSILDLPLLQIVGKTVCVKPDKCLRAFAKKQGWEILDGNKILSSSRNRKT